MDMVGLGTGKGLGVLQTEVGCLEYSLGQSNCLSTRPAKNEVLRSLVVAVVEVTKRQTDTGVVCCSAHARWYCTARSEDAW
jgi:hypothetical protein